MKKFLTSIVFVLYTTVSFTLFAETDGEKLFKMNDPTGAVPLLEKDAASGNVSSDTFNYLGLAYFQLGEYKKSMDAFERGRKIPQSNKKLLYFNQGNVAYASGDYDTAETCYSFALAASPEFYDSLLNRANSRLMMKKYKECLPDYKKYVEVLPDDPQSDNIRKLISYLEEEIQHQIEEEARLAEEQRRLEEENRRLQEELARKEAERLAREAELRAQEEERRRKLLEDVANSLQQTETTNMTAGAEGVLDYDYESELE